MRAVPRPAALLAVVVLGGCASETDLAEFPPAARPAVSPTPTTRPAGTVRSRTPGDSAGARAVRLPDGRRAAIDGRARTLLLTGVGPATGTGVASVSRAPAGVGPSAVAGDDGRLFVSDTNGEAMLVFGTEPEFEPIFRVPVLGSPGPIVTDARRDVVLVAATARNRVLAYDTSIRPRFIGSFPTVRQVEALSVEAGSGTVRVLGADAVQAVPPSAYSRRR